MVKFFGCAAGVACALVLSACGSDSSSGPGGSVLKTKISIDESNQTITSYENNLYDICVYDSIGNRFDWKRNAVTKLDTFRVHYLFKGDTLVLFNDEDGNIFVGGKANTLYGKWNGLENCSYDIDKDEIQCFEADAVGYGSSSLTFYKDYAEAEYIAPEAFNDYTNSVWMRLFYMGIRTQDFMFLPNYLFLEDADSCSSELKKLGVKVKSQSKSKISFVLGEKNVSVEFADVTGDFDDLSYTANVQVDDKTCSLLFARTDVSENLCSAENADYLDLEEYETSDSSFTYAYRYYRNNSDEFFECLNAAFGFAGESDGGIRLYKKQDQASILDANWKRMERIARKLSGSN